MKIIVLMKEVPDTYGDRMLNLETGLADRGASEAVMDEVNERALELALSYADTHSDVEVTVLSMGPESSAASIRKALAIGAGSAVHIVDDELVGADLSLTAETLAAAIRKVGFDLVVAGNVSTDGAGGVVPAMVAELLQVPSMTALSVVELSKDRVSGSRSTETAIVNVNASLPAVISVTEALPEARFATFKGIMAAKKKPVETFSLVDLGVEALHPAAARSILTAVARKPPRAAGVKITDQGDAGARLAEFLVSNRLV